jgi:vanillate O-demethylase ferredoxin subunit
MSSSFEVEFPEVGVTFRVGEGQSIAEAAAMHGVEILTGCTNGQCGTCVVKVLEGEVDHRDSVLTPEKRASGWMCACVSRASGARLRLEIW